MYSICEIIPSVKYAREYSYHVKLSVVKLFMSTRTAILEGPTSQVVANNTRATFYCRAKGEELEWVVNGEYASVPRNEELTRQGVILSDPTQMMYGEYSNTIDFPATARFNLTRILCLTGNQTDTAKSSEAVLTVAGNTSKSSMET